MSTFGHDRNGSGGDKDKSDRVKMEMLLNTYFLVVYRLMRLVPSPANPICTKRSYKEMAINQRVSINSREKRTVIETSQLTWAVLFIWWSEWIVYVLRLGMRKYIPTKWRHCLGNSQQPMIFNLQNHPNDLWKNKRKRFNRNITINLLIILCIEDVLMW